MANELHVTASSLGATEAIGRRLGSFLKPGDVLALVGPLGAGKTHLTRAIAEGMGIRNPDAVNSPTFVLIQEYDGPLPLYHFDTYRLPDEHSFAELGAEEYFQGAGVCVIEWADKIAGQLPPDHLRITIQVVDETTRSFGFSASGARSTEILGRMSQELTSLDLLPAE